MKIFSNFDTKLRQTTFKEYQDKFGVENVLCFWRSKLYQIYKIILPFLAVSSFTLLVLIFFYRRLGGDYFGYIVAAILIINVVFFFPVIGKYIDYKMDFIIVIPHAIMMYDQWGIFKRNVVTISVQSIKAISIKKAWLLYSMFDNGDIIILTEGDSEHNGEIKFRRIPRPDKRRDQMVRVIGMEEDTGSIVTPISDPTPDVSTTV